MTMDPNDKVVLLAYLHQTNLMINEEKTPPREILKRIQTGLEMWKRALEGVTCLSCGLPWSEHPTTTPGGTDHFCMIVNLEAVKQ